MQDLPPLEPSPAGRADAAALAALALVPDDVVVDRARTLDLAALAAAAIARSAVPHRCLGEALRLHLAETRASRHGDATAPARPSRDEVAALATPVAAALRESRRRPPPAAGVARRVERWCQGYPGDRETALVALVRGTLDAARWTGAEPGVVLSAALVRLPGPAGIAGRVLDAAVTWAARTASAGDAA